MTFDDAIRRGEARARQAMADSQTPKDDDVVTPLDAYPVEQAALDAYDAGLCPIRAAADGTKKPLGAWKHWQAELPTRRQITEWFSDGHPGMGLVTGRISGNLELLEFEGRATVNGTVERFKTLLRDAGLYPDWERICRGYSERTPSDGFHVLWRCDTIGGNTKLARHINLRTGEIEVLIETRGEGGFVICAPSSGPTHPTGRPWTRLHGSFATIATIHPELRQHIFDLANQLDELPDNEPAKVKPTGDPGDGGTLPGFDLTVDEVLAEAGFTVHHTDRQGNVHWTRPGKDTRHGSSLTVWIDDGRATPWSTSIGMPGEFITGKRLLTAWQLHVGLNHHGDFTEAGRTWRQNHPQPAPPPLTSITAETIPDDLWDARPHLAHIRQAAHSRQRSADAVLHVALARLSAITPHTTTIPPIVGAPAPLAYFTVIIAPPGVGKSSANQIGGALLPAPDGFPDQIPLGSGEGLAQTLFDLVDETDENGKTRKVNRQVRHNAYIYADEGQTLAEIGGRNGSTLLPTIRTIWTGGDLGQANASTEKRRIVHAGTYVFGACIALQPTRAGALLADVDAGTPQRFGWASATDPTIPESPPDWPGPLNWDTPPTITLGMALDINQTIVDEIRAADLARARGQTPVNPLDAHAGLYRLKVAGLLAVLDGRRDINNEDWQLSEIVKAASDRVREEVAATVAYEADRNEQITRDRLARRHIEANAAEERRRIVDGARKIAAKVHDEPDRWTISEIRRGPLRRWSSIIEDVLEHAVAEGWVVEHREDGRGLDKRRLIPGEKRP